MAAIVASSNCDGLHSVPAAMRAMVDALISRHPSGTLVNDFPAAVGAFGSAAPPGAPDRFPSAALSPSPPDMAMTKPTIAATARAAPPPISQGRVPPPRGRPEPGPLLSGDVAGTGCDQAEGVPGDWGGTGGGAWPGGGGNCPGACAAGPHPGPP
ncbi:MULTISPECIES: hypothetical protein [unclassified Streptomyces]|uniref:hypothetical protein n=1 Tax=unclassified Streptomyces TaxID=2593676 RepID=UPI00336AE661